MTTEQILRNWYGGASECSEKSNKASQLQAPADILGQESSISVDYQLTTSHVDSSNSLHQPVQESRRRSYQDDLKIGSGLSAKMGADYQSYPLPS